MFYVYVDFNNEHLNYNKNNDNVGDDDYRKFKYSN